MIGLVVAGHGDYAGVLVDTARQVMPTSSEVISVGIYAGDDSATFEMRLREAIEIVQKGDGVMVLTDMFGGTPSNFGMTLHDPGVVEVLTGVNLPMLIKAFQLSSQNADLTSAAREVRATGHRSIAVATDMLTVPEQKEPAVTG